MAAAAKVDLQRVAVERVGNGVTVLVGDKHFYARILPPLLFGEIQPLHRVGENVKSIAAARYLMLDIAHSVGEIQSFGFALVVRPIARAAVDNLVGGFCLI